MSRLLALVLCITAVCYTQPAHGQTEPIDSTTVFAVIRRALEESIPAGVILDDGWFIYDLTDPSSGIVMGPILATTEPLVFKRNHFYHFGAVAYQYSMSNIAYVDNGRLKLFKGVNCPNSPDSLESVLEFARKKSHLGAVDAATLVRLANYRSYGSYFRVDFEELICTNRERAQPVLRGKPEDPVYPWWGTALKFSHVVEVAARKAGVNAVEARSRFNVENGRLVGFAVWDLTDPQNKQTSLLEEVNFKDRHVYHFAAIDGPYSYSNIAFLEGGKVTIFESINCGDTEAKLEVVIAFLSEKWKRDNNRSALLKRVRNYRSYGVYVPLDGKVTPSCPPNSKP